MFWAFLANKQSFNGISQLNQPIKAIKKAVKSPVMVHRNKDLSFIYQMRSVSYRPVSSQTFS